MSGSRGELLSANGRRVARWRLNIYAGHKQFSLAGLELCPSGSKEDERA